MGHHRNWRRKRKRETGTEKYRERERETWGPTGSKGFSQLWENFHGRRGKKNAFRQLTRTEKRQIDGRSILFDQEKMQGLVSRFRPSSTAYFFAFRTKRKIKTRIRRYREWKKSEKEKYSPFFNLFSFLFILYISTARDSRCFRLPGMESSRERILRQ